VRTTFCTVITHDYIPFAKALFQSIRKFDPVVECYAFVIDRDGSDIFSDFEILYSKSLSESQLVRDFYSKYNNSNDALRWSLKSVLMIHLLKTGKYDQVFFVDPDLYFYCDFKFLYEELGDRSFMLSPNWGCMHPEKSEIYFQRLLTEGLYNAGFLGATAKALPTLRWWAESCLRACERDKSHGLHDDQGYLNLFPILSPDSKILYHKGCNVAEWNRFEISRSLDEQGNLILDGIYPVVFIHFSNLGYLVEHDPFLIPYLQIYEEELKKNGFEGSLIAPAKNFVHRQRLKNLNFFDRLARKVLGQARFARFKGWEE
jgi:hypothetical protein